jgi:hypothetical protein
MALNTERPAKSAKIQLPILCPDSRTGMSKHRLSPPPLPPSKRAHTSDPRKSTTPTLTFDSAFYDELILCIFSHLSAADLCSAQATNRNWSRLAVDNELWKALYLKMYGRSRLRGARGFIGRIDGREVKSLPGKTKMDELKDWKWMFRISSNWKTGMCSSYLVVQYPFQL